jgi:hypothetical protein
MTTRAAPHLASHLSTFLGSTACVVMQNVHAVAVLLQPVSAVVRAAFLLLIAERRAAHRAERSLSRLSPTTTISVRGGG